MKDDERLVKERRQQAAYSLLLPVQRETQEWFGLNELAAHAPARIWEWMGGDAGVAEGIISLSARGLVELKEVNGWLKFRVVQQST